MEQACLNRPNVEAIAAFEETLTTPDGRFDKWLKGDDKVLSKTELQGYEHFKQFGCIACHNGSAVGGNTFQKFGLVHPYTKDLKNLGRFAVTAKEEDKYVFKVPTLRNIELTAPYFHDASAWTLDEAVKTMAWHQLNLKPKDQEVAAIVAFLKTLTGEQPQVKLPILPPLVQIHLVQTLDCLLWQPRVGQAEYKGQRECCK